MEIEVKYTGLEDRQGKIKEQEAKGLRMLHDDFDNPNWKHGDPIIGTMTFTDVMPLEPPPPIDWKAKWQVADTTAKKLDIIAKRLEFI